MPSPAPQVRSLCCAPPRTAPTPSVSPSAEGTDDSAAAGAPRKERRIVSPTMMTIGESDSAVGFRCRPTLHHLPEAVEIAGGWPRIDL
jgi:hypothetical protein